MEILVKNYNKLNKDDINTLSEIKKKIFSLNIHKNTKLEIYSYY